MLPRARSGRLAGRAPARSLSSASARARAGGAAAVPSGAPDAPSPYWTINGSDAERASVNPSAASRLTSNSLRSSRPAATSVAASDGSTYTCPPPTSVWVNTRAPPGRGAISTRVV